MTDFSVTPQSTPQARPEALEPGPKQEFKHRNATGPGWVTHAECVGSIKQGVKDRYVTLRSSSDFKATVLRC